MILGWCTLLRMFISLLILTKSSSFLILDFSKIFIAIFSLERTCKASLTLPKEPFPKVLKMMYFLLPLFSIFVKLFQLPVDDISDDNLINFIQSIFFKQWNGFDF